MYWLKCYKRDGYISASGMHIKRIVKEPVHRQRGSYVALSLSCTTIDRNEAENLPFKYILRVTF